MAAEARGVAALRCADLSGRSLGRAGTVRLPQGQGQRGGLVAAARSPPPLPRPPSLPRSCSQLGGPLGREAWGAA